MCQLLPVGGCLCHVTSCLFVLLLFQVSPGLPTNIGLCDEAVTTDWNVRILKAPRDNLFMACKCLIRGSQAVGLSVTATFKLSVTQSDCGEKFYFHFNNILQFYRCSDDHRFIQANDSLIYTQTMQDVWLYYLTQASEGSTGYIDVNVTAREGVVSVECNQNGGRTKKRTDPNSRTTLLYSTTNPFPTSTGHSPERPGVWTTVLKTDEPAVHVTQTTNSSKTPVNEGTATTGKPNTILVIIASVVTVALLMLLAVLARVLCCHRRGNFADKGNECNGTVSQTVVYAEPNKLHKTPRSTQPEEPIYSPGSDELDPIPVPAKSWEENRAGSVYYNESVISKGTDTVLEKELYVPVTEF